MLYLLFRNSGAGNPLTLKGGWRQPKTETENSGSMLQYVILARDKYHSIVGVGHVVRQIVLG